MYAMKAIPGFELKDAVIGTISFDVLAESA